MPSDRRVKSGLLSRWLALPNDSTAKTVAVALILCLVCSIIVSASAVILKPLQTQNRARDKQVNILEVAGLWRSDVAVKKIFEERIEARVVDLRTGEYVEEPAAEQYDQRRAAADPQMSIDLDPDQDIAGIGRRANLATVYLVKDGGELELIVLPVHGYGLWSTLYGFLAVEPDGNTVHGIKFYEHAETPGLGGEVDNPRWRDQWSGKKIYDESGEPRLQVVRGTVDPGKPDAEHKIDGLAGATLTGNGVTNLVRFWMGDLGFGKYLQRFSRG